MIEFVTETWTQYPLGCVIFLVVGCVIGAFSGLQLRRFLHILLLKQKSVAFITDDGPAEITGKIRCKAPLDFDSRRVVYFRKAVQYYKSGKHGGWKDASVEERFVPFEIDDGTGTVAVNVDQARFEVKTDRIEKNGRRERTIYQTLEVGETAYAIGHVSAGSGTKTMDKKSSTLFLVSDYGEGKLLWRFGLGAGIPLAAFVLVAGIFAAIWHLEWRSPWEGAVVRTYTYRCGKKNRGTCYGVELSGRDGEHFTKNPGYALWQRLKPGDYLRKPMNDYEILIGE